VTISPSPASVSPAFRAVGRAIADLRRGLPVAVHGDGGAVVAMAAELVDGRSAQKLAALSGSAPILALTAERAAVLRIPPDGDPTVLLALSPHMDHATIRSLADPATDLDNPLRGPFRRAEAPRQSAGAAILLAKHARLLPAVLLAPLPTAEPEIWARQNDLIAVTADAVASHAEDAASSLHQAASAQVPLFGAENTRIVAFRPADGGIEHIAIVVGEPHRDEPVLVRLHSECFTGDLLGSLRCDCGDQLRGAVQLMAKQGSGVLLYLAQEGRGIGLINKLRAYRLQDQGFDTMEANRRLGFAEDERLFRPAAEMLKRLGFTTVRLLTNNPDKVSGLRKLGIDVVERVAHAFPANEHNERYLAAKAQRGHLL
jgi:GTP cyclohydrolase II